MGLLSRPPTCSSGPKVEFNDPYVATIEFTGLGRLNVAQLSDRAQSTPLRKCAVSLLPRRG